MRVVDTTELARREAGDGALWALGDGDLNANVVRLAPGQRVEPHVNADVDVLVTVLSGSGALDVDGETAPLSAGVVAWIPKGARRGWAAGDGGMLVLTAHRRRDGLTIGRRSGPPRPRVDR